MPASIGVNLRVTGHCRQGGRKYMEDFFSVAYQQTQDEKDLEYAFFGIFDGHGGMEAATFAKEHLMESIVRQKNFWSDKDEDVLKAIKDGYINTHYAMWREQEKWPKTASGLPSTAGTTASVAFIRRGKIYIGHVGDSGIILGYQESNNPIWQARPLTEDHKPENKSEMLRIEQCGGKVITKSGVPRVVWNRPRIGHKGPVRRSTPIDEIPFLAVARSLGDLWSYNSALDEFVVSPDPDTVCIPIDADSFRCLIFGTDGLWNMISPASAVNIVQVAEQHNERSVLAAADSQESSPAGIGRASKVWINPSKCLVERALERWSTTRMRADNTSVITLMLDPPGPPRAEVIRNQRLLENRQRQQQLIQQTQIAVSSIESEQLPAIVPNYPETGLEILTMYEDPTPEFLSSDESIPKRFENQPEQQQQQQQRPCTSDERFETTSQQVVVVNNVKEVEESMKNLNTDEVLVEQQPENNRRLTEENLNRVHRQVLEEKQNVNSVSQLTVENDACLKNKLEQLKPDETDKSPKELLSNEIIQINEVSSSSSERSGDDEIPPCSRCTRSQDSLSSQIKLKQHNNNKVHNNRRNLRATSTLSSQLISKPLTTRSVINGKTKLANRSNSTSPLPKRKTRSSLLKSATITITTRKTFVASKREHSDPDLKQTSVPADSTRHRINNINSNHSVEPPQKLRRSQSLGPRDFTLRSMTTQIKAERCLRDRSSINVPSLTTTTTTLTSKNSLVHLAAGSSTNYKKLTSTGKNFTPIKQAIQTRNRVKRLNK